MSELLYYRRSNGEEFAVEAGTALHDRLEADGEYHRITEFEGDMILPEYDEEGREVKTGEESEDAVTIVSLPIDGYDDKSVEEVVPFLDDLDEEQLAIVEAYEIANKNRVTLLEAIEDARSA
jgi:hypothetical protein